MMERTDKNIARKAFPCRPDDAHKGTMGTLLSVCGCYGMAGAGILSALAALRSGVGLFKWALPKSIYPIAAVKVPEGVYLPLRETVDGKIAAENLPLLQSAADSSNAVLLGCGLSVCEDTRKVVTELVASCEKPMVLDADALNCIAGQPAILKKAKGALVITPHPVEMGRLTGKSAAEVNADRQGTAEKFAREYGVVTVLKGAGTIIASPNGRTMINKTGNSGMATGGSGDVLAGMLASLLAQGADAFDAAAAAVYLHGLAGDIAAQRIGKISLLPSDLIDTLPCAFRVSGI